MCDICLANKTSLADPVAPLSGSVIRRVSPDYQKANEEYRKRRPKLWELELDLHCSIIGTCAATGTLRKIYDKVSKGSSKHLTDYQIHNLFVSSADRPQVGIKMLHKHLEKTYAVSIARSRELASEEELAKFWDECVEKGEIAAGYWAIMTHQKVTSELGNTVFGAVHMFSHLAGRQLQAETVKRKTSRQETGELRKLLAIKEKAVADLQKSLVSSDLEKEELLLQIHNQHQCNESYLGQIEKLSSSSELVKADKKIKLLEKKLHASQNRQKAKQATTDDKYNATIAYMQESLDASRDQIAALEGRLEGINLDTEATESSDSSVEDLCGRCVLYVGGQTGCQSNFRQLVETRNGRFLYHDGGREDSRQRLKSMLGKADAVICPVSCVSHSATCNIKRICSRKEKKMIWIKSPSLAAFNSALFEVNQDANVTTPNHVV